MSINQSDLRVGQKLQLRSVWWNFKMLL